MNRKKLYVTATRRSKSRQEIATEFGISRRTFYRWIQRTDIVLPPGLIPPKIQDMIYDEFGDPNPSNYWRDESMMTYR
jgi:DNA invertase Pin-like site-specific DNA recombinase